MGRQKLPEQLFDWQNMNKKSVPFLIKPNYN